MMLAPGSRYSFLEKIITWYPLLLIFPFNLSLYVPGLPLITPQRIFLLFIILVLIFSEGFFRFFQKMVRNKLAITLFAAFFILPLLSIPNSFDKSQSMKVIFGERFFLLPFTFFCGFVLLRKKEATFHFLQNVTIALVFVLIIGFVQYIMDYDVTYDIVSTVSTIPQEEYEKYRVQETFEEREGISRIKSTFFHPIAFGVVVATYVSFFYGLRKYNFYRNPFFIIAGVLAVGGVAYMSVTRTTLALFVLIMFSYIIISGEKKWLFYFLPLSIPLMGVYSYFSKMGYSFSQDSGRALIIADTVRNLDIISFTGIGVGTFLDTVYDNPILFKWTLVDPLAMNLTMIIECGILYIPLFFIWTTTIVKTLRENIRYYSADTFQFHFSQILLAMFVGNLLTSFYSLSIFNADPVATSSFWMLVGASFGMHAELRGNNR